MASLDRVVNVVAAASCVIAVALLLRREVGSSLQSSKQVDPSTAAPVKLTKDEWNSVSRASRVVGGTDSGVQVVVFSDFECPACATMHQTLKQLDSARSGSVSLRMVHYPLSMHRFAAGAANGAECAAESGRFVSFTDEVFRQQRRLGLVSWGSMAGRAGIKDTARISACVIADDLMPRVSEGIDLGRKLKVDFTPTVIVQGWRWPVSPSLGQLIASVDSITSRR